MRRGAADGGTWRGAVDDHQRVWGDQGSRRAARGDKDEGRDERALSPGVEDGVQDGARLSPSSRHLPQPDSDVNAAA